MQRKMGLTESVNPGHPAVGGVPVYLRRAAAFLFLVAAGALLCLGSSRASERFTPLVSEVQSASSRATFPHGKPKHKTLECSKCHTISPAKIDVKEFPGHGACVSCHNLAIESISKPAVFCGICHDQPRPGALITKAQSALFRFPKPDTASQFGIAFSHPSHLKPDASRDVVINRTLARQGLSNSGNYGPPPKCADCHHAQLLRAPAAEISTDTGHRSCFVCHDEHPFAKPSMYQCADCHKRSGLRSPHLYGLVRDFKHSDHDYDIRPKRKADFRVPRAPDYLCTECHTAAAAAASLDAIRLPQQRYCAECHNGKVGLPDVLSRKVLDSLENH
jgi:hypothetical protein